MPESTEEDSRRSKALRCHCIIYFMDSCKNNKKRKLPIFMTPEIDPVSDCLPTPIGRTRNIGSNLSCRIRIVPVFRQIRPDCRNEAKATSMNVRALAVSDESPKHLMASR